jgi:hypothetical protein
MHLGYLETANVPGQLVFDALESGDGDVVITKNFEERRITTARHPNQCHVPSRSVKIGPWSKNGKTLGMTVLPKFAPYKLCKWASERMA